MAIPNTPVAPTKPYKAIAAFVLAFLAQLLVEFQGKGGDGMTTTEWVVAVVSALVVAGVVWGVPNPPVSGARRGQAGEVATRTLAMVALIIAVVLVVLLFVVP